MVLGRKTNFFLGKKKNSIWDFGHIVSQKIFFLVFPRLGKSWLSFPKPSFPGKTRFFTQKPSFPRKKLVFLSKTIFFLGKTKNWVRVSGIFDLVLFFRRAIPETL